jgi:hypothetical protein
LGCGLTGRAPAQQVCEALILIPSTAKKKKKKVKTKISKQEGWELTQQ